MKDRRAIVVRLRAEGKTIAEIAKLYNTSIGSVYYWEHGTYDKRRIHKSQGIKASPVVATTCSVCERPLDGLTVLSIDLKKSFHLNCVPRGGV